MNLMDVEQALRNAQAIREIQEADAALDRSFAKDTQSDWMRSLRRVAKAQAILWHETPIAERHALLARVDREERGA